MTTTNIDTKAARELAEAAEFGPWDNDVLTLCAELDSTRAELAAARATVERVRALAIDWTGPGTIVSSQYGKAILAALDGPKDGGKHG